MVKENSVEGQRNIKGELEQAVLQKDLNAVISLVTELDRLLIGPKTKFSRQNSYREDEIGKLFENDSATVKIYLGDGGISRLIIAKEDGKVSVFIGETSREVVKAKWEKI